MARHRPEGRLSAALSAVVAVLCLVSGLSAQAAPPDRDRARTRLAEGVKLLEMGKPAAALARFEEAYAIVPSPKVQYNMGLALRRLDRHAEAFMAFERFLRDGTNESTEYVSHARQELERLSKRVAFVELACDVPGAAVQVDGRAVGVTPLADRLPVDTGPHDLVVTAPTLGSKSRRFTAVAGETIPVRISLRGPAPTVAVPNATPAPPPSFVQEREVPAPTNRGGSWKRITGYGLLVVGAAGAIGGGYLLLRGGDDGCGERIPGFACNTERPSKLPGWILLGTGAGLALGGAFVLYSDHETQVAVVVAPGAVSLKGSL